MSQSAKPEATEVSEKSSLEIIDIVLKYTKDILVIIGLVGGIGIGYPALRKKLTEDHVKKLIQEIQDSNKEIKIICHTSIDKHLSRTYKNEPVSEHDLQSLYNELDTLHKKSLNASKEVVTFVFYLKRTVQGVLRQYPPSQKIHSIITTGEIYGLYIMILQEIVLFTTKIVNIPHSSSTKQFRYINKKIEPFMTKTRFKRFKHFEQGVDNKIASPLLSSFYSQINRCSNILILKAAYKITQSPAPISRLLYLNKIYFPVILKSITKDMFGYRYYHLVGFNRSLQFSKEGEKVVYNLNYANISDVFHFTRALNPSKIFTEFKDAYINSKGISQVQISKIGKGEFENISVTVEEAHISRMFKRNKRILKRKMKNEIG